MSKYQKLDDMKDILDKWTLKTQEFISSKVGSEVPLEAINIANVCNYFLKNATTAEKKEANLAAENMYLIASQTLLYKEDLFFADVLKHLERDRFDYTLQAPAAVWMPKSDNEIHLIMNPFRLAQLCKNYTELAAVLEHECLHVLNRHLQHYSNPMEFGISHDDLNISLDCAINQMLNNLTLPDCTIDLKAFCEIYGYNEADILEKQDAGYYIKKASESPVSKQDQKMKSNYHEPTENENNDNDFSDPNQNNDDNNNKSSDGGQTNESSSSKGGNQSSGKSNGAGERPSDRLLSSSNADGHGKWSDKDAQTNEDLIESAIDKLINDTVHNKTRGYQSAAFEGKFVDVKPPKPIDWRKYVRESMQGMVDGLRSAPWRPSRRHPFNLNYSGVTNSYKMNVYAAIDTSGSLSDEEISGIILELHNFAKTFEANFTVLECDAEINAIHNIRNNKDLSHLKDEIKGRGGTSYVPVFEYLIRKNFDGNKDILLYFTDGYGESEQEFPEYIYRQFDPNKMGSFKNVIWVITQSPNNYFSDGSKDTPAHSIKVGQHVTLLLEE